MNIGEMMQQAKAMQEKMAKLQKEIAEMLVEGSAGGGMVKVVMKCNKEVLSVTIDPSIVNSEEIEMLEDLIIAATNDAGKKAEEKAATETKNLMADMGLPAGMDMPF